MHSHSARGKIETVIVQQDSQSSESIGPLDVSVSATEHGAWVELCAVVALPETHRAPRSLPWVGLYRGACSRDFFGPTPAGDATRAFSALRQGMSNLSTARLTLVVTRGQGGHPVSTAAALTFASKAPLDLRITGSFHTSADHSCLALGGVGEAYSAPSPRFIVSTAVDRNALLPQCPELDETFSRLLRHLGSLADGVDWGYASLPLRRAGAWNDASVEAMCRWVLEAETRSMTHTGSQGSQGSQVRGASPSPGSADAVGKDASETGGVGVGVGGVGVGGVGGVGSGVGDMGDSPDGSQQGTLQGEGPLVSEHGSVTLCSSGQLYAAHAFAAEWPAGGRGWCRPAVFVRSYASQSDLAKVFKAIAVDLRQGHAVAGSGGVAVFNPFLAEQLEAKARKARGKQQQKQKGAAAATTATAGSSSPSKPPMGAARAGRGVAAENGAAVPQGVRQDLAVAVARALAGGRR